MSKVATVEKLPARSDVFNLHLDEKSGELKAALPDHIPVERFIRVVKTALQQTPALLECDGRSLWNACLRAAQDGLLPDGREGAIVSYKGHAQWLPMIAGLRTKARRSGEIATWEVQVVHENDQFQYELGDDPFIRHAPALSNRGKIIAAYSIATLKDGSKSREVMSIEEIEGVRSKSKAQSGPWSDRVFYPEMVRKTVARRHYKVLPSSTDLDLVVRRDDELYDIDGNREEAQAARPRSLAGKLDALASLPERTIDHEAADVSHSEKSDPPEIEQEAPQDAEDPGPVSDSREAPERAPEPPMAESGGVDEAETFLRSMKALFRDAKATKAVDNAWRTMVQPRIDDGDMFPGDLGDLERARDAAKKRLAEAKPQ